MTLRAYGLRTVVEALPAWVPPSPTAAPLLAAAQPGLWGNLLLGGLAASRLAERVDRPTWPGSPG